MLRGARKRLGLLLLALLGLAAVAVWFARDLPRRRVEAALTARLGTEVEVGRLTSLGTRRVVLEDLTLRGGSWQPGLERATVRRVEALGDLTEIAAGRLDVLRVDGLEARFTGPPVLASGGPTLEAGRVEVKGAKLTVAAGAVATTLDLEADLENVGRDIGGTVRVRTDELLVGPPAGITVSRLEATAKLGDQGRKVDLEATADSVSLGPDLTGARLERPRLSGTIALPAAGGLEVALTPSWDGLASGQVELAMAGPPWKLTRQHTRLTGLRLEPWLDRLARVPAGWGATGTADLELEGTPDSGLHLVARVEQLDLATPLGALAAAGQLEGRGLGAAGSGMPLRGDLKLWQPQPAVGSPMAELLPATAVVEGDLTGGASPSFAGHVEVATASLGTVEAHGTVETAATSRLQLEWSWAGCDPGRLPPLAAAAGLPFPTWLKLAGPLAASGSARGETGSPGVNGTLAVKNLAVAPESATWSVALSPRASFAWSPATESLAVSVSDTEVTLTAPPLDPLPLTANASAGFDLRSRRLTLSRLTLDAGGLGRGVLDGQLGGDLTGAGHLHLEGIQPGPWSALLRPVIGKLLAGWQLSGAATGELDLAAIDGGSLSASGTLTLEHGGLASADSSRVVQELAGQWRVTAALDENHVDASATGTLGRCQALWGTVYADASDLEAEVEVSVTMPLVDTGPARRARIGCRLPGALAVTASAEAGGESPLDWTARVASPDLKTLLEKYIQPPLQGSIPAVDRLSARGTLSLEIEGRTAAGQNEAGGTLSLHGVDVGTTGGAFAASAIDIDLPFDLRWMTPAEGAALELSGDPRAGLLRFAGLAAVGVNLPATSIPLVSQGDTVTLTDNLSLPLLGGRLELAGLTFTALARPDRHLATGVRLDGIDLAELARTFALPPLSGHLDGHFPDIRLTADTMSVDGAGTLELFGGTISVSGISGRDMLSRYPRLKLSAQLQDISLDQLTQAFDFGTASGVLEGHVTDCELFGTVPVSFTGRLQTVPRPGVKQRISIKAINTIAIVGTGSKVGLLDRGIHRLLRNYSYAGFGLEMRLEQDQFLLRGLERRGDRELFLKGQLPFRLDVVNVEPGTTVSFRTMLERLQNLDIQVGAPHSGDDDGRTKP